MTDEQLQDWHTTFLSEAQRENYVNHNLEIVRHYRTEAIARAPAFDLERNAIDAAIARHGLYVSSANEGAAESTAAGNGIGSGAGGQDEVLPPPQRRPRIEQQQHDDPTCSTRSSSSSGGGGGGGGAASSSSVGLSSVTGTAASNYGHFVALAHIFDSYATRGEPARAVSAGIGEVPTANGNSSSNKDREDATAAAGTAAVADISDMAISKTVDSLGLRRSH